MGLNEKKLDQNNKESHLKDLLSNRICKSLFTSFSFMTKHQQEYVNELHKKDPKAFAMAHGLAYPELN